MTSSGGLDTLCWGSVGTVERCQPVAEKLRRNNTWWDVTIIPHFVFGGPFVAWVNSPHAMPVLDHFRRRSREALGGVIPRGNWLRDTTGVGPLPGAETGVRVDAQGQVYGMALIERLNVPILAGTDVIWVWPVSPMGKFKSTVVGMALHAELAMMQAEGLSPLHALQAATLNPAKLLHGTDSLGTVAPGKLADLVLLDANPLEDITNTTAIRAVVANGRYYDRAALDQLWMGIQRIIKHRGLPFFGIL
jgi:hypothetical protein